MGGDDVKKGVCFMKKVSSILLKASSMLTALALTIGVSSMNSACMMWFNQPKAPEEMEKYIK